MTQDPYGQPPGPGYVVGGEAVPDDGANVTTPTTPMTHFQKVASAFREAPTDPAVTDRASSDEGAEPAGGTHGHGEETGETGSEEATAGESPDGPAADATAQDPAGTQPALGDFSRLLPDAAEFRARWQQVQFRFVDDPRGSVTEAADVIAQVTAKLEAAIQERQRAIADRQRALRDRWGEGSADTESLRETLLMYRTLLGQLTGPKAG